MSNQASEDELLKDIEQCFIKNNMCDCGDEHTSLSLDETEFFDVEAVVKDIKQLIRTEKLKLLNELERKSTHYTPDGLVADGLDPWAVSVATINAVRNKLEAEL